LIEERGMRYEIKKQGDIHVLYLYGNVTISEVGSLGDEMKERILKKEITYLIINFKEVSFIDSWGLSIIISIYKNIMMVSGILVACELCDDVKNFFSIIKLDTIINVYETEDEAIKYMQKKVGEIKSGKK